jgi:N-acetylmuramoyl-L-alanine amidase
MSLPTLFALYGTMFILIFSNAETLASEYIVQPTVITEPINEQVVIPKQSLSEILSDTTNEKSSEVEKKRYLSNEDIELIALVTMAEAEGECEEGKRLVIDTILNRVDSEHFPDTVYDVVYQENQFSSMWNGRVERCEVQEDICRLVEEELVEQQNTDVIYFTAGGYGKYGVPLFQVENHYFSSYE